MIDVKKLVTGFLVLAVAASGAALAISAVGGAIGASGVNGGGAGANAGATNAENNLADVAATGGDEATASGYTGNAFLPPLTENADGLNQAAPSSSDTIADDPSNLTDAFASAYMADLMSANPSGLQSDVDGNTTLNQPDVDTVIQQVETSSTLAKVQIPNWDTEAAEVPITVVSSSPTALASYGSALQNILDNDFVQDGLQSLLNQNSDPSAGPYVDGKVQEALQDVSGLHVPASAAPFQRSLIKVLVYSKNSLALIDGSSTDPLQVALIAQAEQNNYQTAIQDFQNQIQEAQSENLFSLATTTEAGGGLLATIQAAVGIPVAHAQFAVSDPITESETTGTVIQLIAAYMKNIAIQLAKNALVLLMQKTIYSWIQGSNGVPHFIQNWATTLANAYEQSALGALNSQMTCIAGAPFAAQVRLALGAPYVAGNNNVCAVQFQRQLSGNTLSQFYNNFSNNGGWLTYGLTLQPGNNYYGSLFFTAQTVANTAQNAQAGIQSKSVAAQGFTGNEVCPNYPNWTPNFGSHDICEDGSTPNSDGTCGGGTQPYCQDGSAPDSDGGCANGQPALLQAAPSTPAILAPNTNLCPNGSEPTVLTPGQVTAQSVGTAIGSNFNLVTNATDLSSLVGNFFTSLLTSLLNSLASQAITAGNGLIQSAAGGINAQNNAAPVSESTPIACGVPQQISSNPVTYLFQASGGDTINSKGQATPASYSWSLQSATIGTGPTLTETFNVPGTYIVNLINTVNGIGATCQAVIVQ